MGFQQRPTAGEPGFQPPPYSSFAGFQSQGYSAMPPISATAPSAPEVPVPSQQETSPYCNPMNQMYANEPLPTEATSPDETQIESSRLGYSNKKKRCRYKKIFLLICPVLIMIGICAHALTNSYARNMQKQDVQGQWQEKLNLIDMQYDKKLAEKRRLMDLAQADYKNRRNRYKRWFDEPWKNYEDYDFDRLNDATMTMVNTLAKSGKVVTEQPRYDSGRRNWSIYRLFKRSVRE